MVVKIWGTFIAHLFFGLILPSTTLASDPLHLPLEDRHVRGETWISIADKINAQGLDSHALLPQMKVMRLSAKSQLGGGYAHLKVGDWVSPTFLIGCDLLDFNNDLEITFSSIEFDLTQVPQELKTQPWHLMVGGDEIILRRIMFSDDANQRGPLYGKIVTIDCRCPYGAYRTCRAPGTILNAHLKEDLSRKEAPCVKDQTWGFFSNRIWVDYGCHGVFDVWVEP